MWYPICQSAHVKDRPLGLRRLGSDIVVWRDSRGKVHTHDDRCLHRGAKLSLGRILNDMLRCAYHGWCYDNSGQCITIPTSQTAQTKLAPRLKLQALETQERAGLVWAYFSEDGERAAFTIVRLIMALDVEERRGNGGYFRAKIEFDSNHDRLRHFQG